MQQRNFNHKHKKRKKKKETQIRFMKADSGYFSAN